jgi:DNA-directed RNA polymerase subunit RPC12/RpoP
MSTQLDMPLSLPDNGSQEYKCKTCGKKFGDSLGDMERHILTEHMQRADFSILKTK